MRACFSYARVFFMRVCIFDYTKVLSKNKLNTNNYQSSKLLSSSFFKIITGLFGSSEIVSLFDISLES